MNGGWSDEDLVQRIRMGDRELYGTLAIRHRRRLRDCAQRLAGDPFEAEDAVQTAHVLAMLHFDSYQGRSPVVEWLVSITKNAVRSGYRRNHLWLDRTELNDCYADPGPSPEQAAIGRDLRRIVDRALEGIPRPYRAVFQLRFVAGLSTAETGRSLGLSEECVKARLLRARSMLRQAIEPQLASRRSRRRIRVSGAA
jgi:RNA polymerase sigma-70 factor (ECF subfamily)